MARRYLTVSRFRQPPAECGRGPQAPACRCCSVHRRTLIRRYGSAGPRRASAAGQETPGTARRYLTVSRFRQPPAECGRGPQAPACRCCSVHRRTLIRRYGSAGPYPASAAGQEPPGMARRYLTVPRFRQPPAECGRGPQAPACRCCSVHHRTLIRRYGSAGPRPASAAGQETPGMARRYLTVSRFRQPPAECGRGPQAPACRCCSVHHRTLIRRYGSAGPRPASAAGQETPAMARRYPWADSPTTPHRASD